METGYPVPVSLRRDRMIGQSFAGRYSLEQEIGLGRTSRVFVARDVETGHRVAVKVLYIVGCGAGVECFCGEPRMIAELPHPNIVRVYEVGEADFEGKMVPYAAMEYVSGGDLMSLIEVRKRLSERETARIGADVAAALSYAHERNVVHEDIKPQNILMEDLRRAKLTDFNVVRAQETGGFGAPRYAVPECFEGEALPASDVYSLGVTLYQTVVGGPPFRGNRRTVIRQHAEEMPIPPAERSQISADFNAVILRCLEKRPSRRPGAAELERELRRISRRAIAHAASRRLRSYIGRRLSPRS